MRKFRYITELSREVSGADKVECIGDFYTEGDVMYVCTDVDHTKYKVKVIVEEVDLNFFRRRIPSIWNVLIGLSVVATLVLLWWL